MNEGKSSNITSDAQALANVIRAAKETLRKMRTKRQQTEAETKEMFALYASIDRADEILARFNASEAGADVHPIRGAAAGK